MNEKIRESTYKDIDAVIMENDTLCAVFLPHYGGKMASLYHKKKNREFLVQAKGKMYKKLEYGGVYIDAECSGFDDMFPTIDEWTYQEPPWKGAVMPDHGEVCGLKWEYEIMESGTCLHCWVYGVRFPYRLDKWMRFKAETELSIEYKAVNMSPFDFDFVWAAHFMINAEQGATILTPYTDGAKATCMFSNDQAFAVPGMTMKWPETVTVDKKTYDITQTDDFQETTYKFYFNEPLPEGWCGYAYKSDGTNLLLKVSEKTVPYLGIWVNNGAFMSYYNIALELCTGSFDDPGRAIEKGQNSVLPGNGQYIWKLDVCIE